MLYNKGLPLALLMRRENALSPHSTPSSSHINSQHPPLSSRLCVLCKTELFGKWNDRMNTAIEIAGARIQENSSFRLLSWPCEWPQYRTPLSPFPGSRTVRFPQTQHIRSREEKKKLKWKGSCLMAVPEWRRRRRRRRRRVEVATYYL